MSILKTYIELNSYQDKSIVCVIPTRGMVDIRVVDAWFKLITPINHKFTKLFMSGGELADSYNTAIITILNHPDLQNTRWLLTMEDDNIPPPDGILKLVDSMLKHENDGDKYWAISGTYFTKPSRDYIEHAPIAFGCGDTGKWNMMTPPLKDDGSVTQCCLIPQGFTLYDLNIFRKLEYPWFKTVEYHDSSRNIFDKNVCATQDAYLFENMWNNNMKIGCRGDIRVGHLDPKTNEIW